MPIRTVNLKLVLGKKNDTSEIRQALWFTHSMVNKAVARIEQLLLLCRGDAYWTLDVNGKEILVPEHQVTADALTLARDIQKKNGIQTIGSNDDILSALRSLYENIIPSCLLEENGNPVKGNAQASKAWISPLMDPDSEGGLSVYEKVLDPSPSWIDRKENDDPEWEHDSMAWLETPEGQRLQNYPGSPPGWLRKLRSHLPWQNDFIVDQKKKRKEIENGSAPLIKKLNELGLLPLCEPTIRMALNPNEGGVSVWDRLAVRFAVAHLLSWESWNHRTRKEHDAAKVKLDALKEDYSVFSNGFSLIDRYEKERHQQLKKVSLADDANPYRIGSRSIRGWDRVREQWMQSGHSTDERRKAVRALQGRLGGKFGDPDLFFWLAMDGCEPLWQQNDILTPFVKLNIAGKFLDKRKEYALMTFADARLHPRWSMFEAAGGTNLRQYTLIANNDGIILNVPLLFEDKERRCTEKKFSVKVAPSGQLAELQLTRNGEKGTKVSYRSSYQQLSGMLGGAELLFDRPYLENDQRNEDLLAENPGTVWLKLSIDVASQAPEGWLDGKGRTAMPPEVHHFRTSLANKSKYSDQLTHGLHVLSVDLGLRSFATCAVFELVRGRPDKALCFPAADGKDAADPNKLWAKHVRSFKLAMPGETPTPKEEAARMSAREELRSIRRDIFRLKDILRLSVVEDEVRRNELIATLIESITMDSTVENTSRTGLDPALFIDLGTAIFRSKPDLWEQHCKTFYDKAEQVVSCRFSQWRKHTRRKSASWADWRERRGYHGGKSIWMLEYLDEVRKLVIGWNLRGRAYREINRADRKQFGTIASGLLHHINQIKDDRIKTGADLIIQAARGYVPVEGGNGWIKKHEPCRLILFEDLSRYRFRVDRPRKENSQLMKWNHREIITAVTMQAELYGLNVDTTAAGFSSRYLASNEAPGVRCRHLANSDFEGGLPKTYVVRELEWMLGNASGRDFAESQRLLGEMVKPGMWVPWSGGEMFASLNDKKKIQYIHADINAAQNLQHRFWSRSGNAFRIVCKKVDQNGIDAWTLEKQPGARLSGALRQLPHGDKEFILIEDDTKGNGSALYVMRPAGKGKKLGAVKDDTDEDDGLEDAIFEILPETGAGREVFFRDPSGIFFPPENWVLSKIYWSKVKRDIWKQMSANALQTTSQEKDALPF